VLCSVLHGRDGPKQSPSTTVALLLLLSGSSTCTLILFYIFYPHQRNIIFKKFLQEKAVEATKQKDEEKGKKPKPEEPEGRPPAKYDILFIYRLGVRLCQRWHLAYIFINRL
jgi:hypothetical protein